MWWVWLVVGEAWLCVSHCVWRTAWAPPLCSSSAEDSGRVSKCGRSFDHLPQSGNSRVSRCNPRPLQCPPPSCSSIGPGKTQAPPRPAATQSRLPQPQLCLSRSRRGRRRALEAGRCVWVGEGRDSEVWGDFGWDFGLGFGSRLQHQLTVWDQ